MMKKLKVTVDGKVYEVSVEIEGEAAAPVAPAPAPVAPVASAPIAPAPVAPAPVAAPAPAAAPAAVPAGASGVPSPLAGKVVSIDTKVGATVKDGDQILTIEAMKMNTYIYANKAGTVSAINVNVGDGVEEGQVLAVIA
ncbi:MAG: acetyl-CoA carboxylase biotin carboxyl carrier protein subunit [Opitutales bacterium]|nr:acetyl-CoA carboxylase biotin carboxyl carrier protein subunit [Opitutales bacterium]